MLQYMTQNATIVLIVNVKFYPTFVCILVN